jgi:hypothetical protein
MLMAVMLAMVLLLPTSAAFAGGETDATIRIVISPINGDPGTEIAVTGEGAKPGITVRVMIAANGNTGEGEIAGVEVTPAEDGTFSATITVPEGTAPSSAIKVAA